MRLSIPAVVAWTFVAGYSLAGCAAVPVKPPVAAPVCLPVRTYTPAQKDALAAAVAALPADNPIVPAVGEYVTLRKAARAACGK